MANKTLKVLTREALLQPVKLKKEKVELDQDTCIYVREMTGAERSEFEQLVQVYDKETNTYMTTTENFLTKVVVCSACDENGTLLFTKQDVETLAKNLPIRLIQKIAEVASELNKVDEEEITKKVKN